MIGSTLVAALGLVAVTYASPIAVQDTSAAIESFQSWQTGGLIRDTRNSSEVQGSLSTADCARGKDPYGACCPETAQRTNGDGGGWGLQIKNGDTQNAQNLYVYINLCDSMPLKYITLGAGDTKFVSIPHNFQGRVTRGNDNLNLQGQAQWLGTWFEFNFDPSGDGRIWGDVSLIRGYDGPVTLSATDGTGAARGFSNDILPGAPGSAIVYKPDGAKDLAPTEDGNTSSENYCLSQVQGQAYCDETHGSPVIVSQNSVFDVTFYAGYV